MNGKLGTGGKGRILGYIPFVNRIIQLCNKLPMNALGTFSFKPSTFRKRVRKVINEVM